MFFTYELYILQLIRYPRSCIFLQWFPWQITSAQEGTIKLRLSSGAVEFIPFYRQHHDLVDCYGISVKKMIDVGFFSDFRNYRPVHRSPNATYRIRGVIPTDHSTSHQLIFHTIAVKKNHKYVSWVVWRTIILLLSVRIEYIGNSTLHGY